MSAEGASPTIWIVNQYAGSPRHGMEYRHYHLARALAERGHRVVVVSGSRSHLFTPPPRVSRPFTLELIDGVTYCWVAVPRYERCDQPRARPQHGRVRRCARSPADEPAPAARRDSRVVPVALPRPGRVALGAPLRRTAGLRGSRHLAADAAGARRPVEPASAGRAHATARGLRLPQGRPRGLGPAAARAAHGLSRHGSGEVPLPAQRHRPDGGADRRGASRGPRRHPAGAVHRRVRRARSGGRTCSRRSIDAARLLGPDEAQIVVVGHGPERRPAGGARGGPAQRHLRRTDTEAATWPRCWSSSTRATSATGAARCTGSASRPTSSTTTWRPGGRCCSRPTAANQPVREADCGRTVPPEDPAALAAAIRSLAACSPAERERLGANARAYVEQHHDYGAPGRRARRHPAGRRAVTARDELRRAMGELDRRAARPRHAVLAGPRCALRDPAARSASAPATR